MKAIFKTHRYVESESRIMLMAVYGSIYSACVSGFFFGFDVWSQYDAFNTTQYSYHLNIQIRSAQAET